MLLMFQGFIKSIHEDCKCFYINATICFLFKGEYENQSDAKDKPKEKKQVKSKNGYELNPALPFSPNQRKIAETELAGGGGGGGGVAGGVGSAGGGGGGFGQTQTSAPQDDNSPSPPSGSSSSVASTADNRVETDPPSGGVMTGVSGGGGAAGDADEKIDPPLTARK